MINAEQIRAARALLDWSTADLAKQAGLTVNGINKIERGHVQAHRETLERLQRIFEAAELEFLPNSGLRKKDQFVQIFEGRERFDDFYEFIYQHLKQNGGEVCLSVVDERMLGEYRKDPDLHRNRMRELHEQGRIAFRILATEGDFSSSYARYRWQPQQSSIPTSFYAFGNCLAMISFTHSPAPHVILIQSGPLAEAYRQAFNAAWERATDPTPQQLRDGRKH